jgi:ribosomal protein S12 methylthiotransferase
MVSNSKQKKVFFLSLGCPRNVIDTEVMVGLATTHGYTIVTSLDQADFIIINTCGFLEAARQEALQTIRSVLEQKEPHTKVIVAGCLVQLKDGSLEQFKNEIHYCLGSGDVEEILTALSAEKPAVCISAKKSFLGCEETPRTLSTPPHYAYVKIAEGCKKGCSYCIIPQIKGPLKSKPEAQILNEIKSLLNRGVKELIFVAQDLGDWGKDLGYKGSDGLISLLRKVLEIEKDFFIRLLYVYPDEITKEFVELMASDQRILPYLDMPIQHIDDTILKAMRRKTTRQHIEECISLLRTAMPAITLRTSLIVGFPGEEESHFEKLCTFVEDTQFSHLGIFAYSKEELSSSFSLPNHVPEEIKESRCRRLITLQKKIVKKNLQKLVGKPLPIVVDGYHPETKLLLAGRHAGQCPEIDPIVIINDPSQVKAFGKRYLVEITGVSEYDLVAKVIKNLE